MESNARARISAEEVDVLFFLGVGVKTRNLKLIDQPLGGKRRKEDRGRDKNATV
jgi:hypothetical protein